MTTFKWLTLGALLGFSVAMGVSCGPAKCTPQSCAFGCCDATGTCQTGVSDSQCGGQGRACTACVLGQTCQLGQCTLVGAGGGSGQGGGSGGGGGTTGGGGGTTGGGGGTTGGGGGTTGGGGGTTGGGGGTTGGGGGTTGGGGGTTGGGGGSGDPACTAVGAGATTFFAGRSTCSSGGVTLTNNPNLVAQCNVGIAQCNTTDRQALSSFGSCIGTTPCTTGNEAAAVAAFQNCFVSVELSPSCSSAIFGTGVGGGSGGGGGTTGGGGGTTGGGTGCTAVSSMAAVSSRARGTYTNATALEWTHADGMTAVSDPSNYVNMEVIWAVQGTGTGVTVPGTRDLATEGTYFSCSYCMTMARDCTATPQTCMGGTCSITGRACTTTCGPSIQCSGGIYLAQEGMMTVSSAPRTTSGSFVGSATNVRFVEWNLETNVPITNGRCYLVPQVSISASVVP